MPDDPAQLLAALDRLRRAKTTEAAALLDVKDRQADRDEADEILRRAERNAGYASERTRNAKLALSILEEKMTDCDFEPELDPSVITGPEERDIV